MSNKNLKTLIFLNSMQYLVYKFQVNVCCRLPLCVKLTSMAAHGSGKNPKQQELWSSKQHLFKNTKHAHRVKIRHKVAGRAFLDASFLLFVAIIKKQLCCQMPLLFLFISDQINTILYAPIFGLAKYIFKKMGIFVLRRNGTPPNCNAISF